MLIKLDASGKINLYQMVCSTFCNNACESHHQHHNTVEPRVSMHLRPSAQRPDTRECPDMRDSKRTPIFGENN